MSGILRKLTSVKHNNDFTCKFQYITILNLYKVYFLWDVCYVPHIKMLMVSERNTPYKNAPFLWMLDKIYQGNKTAQQFLEKSFDFYNCSYTIQWDLKSVCK